MSSAASFFQKWSLLQGPFVKMRYSANFLNETEISSESRVALAQGLDPMTHTCPSFDRQYSDNSGDGKS
jgi:hypothetical protein